jgi:outer membrane receptor protein involved in Fe transport
MRGTNELLNIRQPDNSFDYQSAGETRHKGVELGLTFKPDQQLFFRFGGTYAIHRFIEFTLSQRVSDVLKNVNGFDMPSAPKFVYNTEITYYPKWLPDFHLSLEAQRVSSWYQNQINSLSYEGYAVYNSRLAYKWKKVEWFTNILNLTDELYAYNASRGNSSTDRTTYTPAAPRTFVFGMQYSISGKTEK